MRTGRNADAVVYIERSGLAPAHLPREAVKIEAVRSTVGYGGLVAPRAGGGIGSVGECRQNNADSR